MRKGRRRTLLPYAGVCTAQADVTLSSVLVTGRGLWPLPVPAHQPFSQPMMLGEWRSEVKKEPEGRVTRTEALARRRRPVQVCACNCIICRTLFTDSRTLSVSGKFSPNGVVNLGTLNKLIAASNKDTHPRVSYSNFRLPDTR